MTRAQKVAKAQELRKRGLSYHQIAAQLSAAYSSVYYWLNSEIAREARKRSRDRSHGDDSSPRRCSERDCITVLCVKNPGPKCYCHTNVDVLGELLEMAA